MAADLRIRVNDETFTVRASLDTPLLYVLTDELALKGPRFGCGLGQCGCCSVLADGVEIRSCITPISRVGGKAITTLEGLPAYYAMRMKLDRPPLLHPLQEALIAEQAAQCGYCTSGILISAAALLKRRPEPSEAEVRAALDRNLCRCGAHNRIVRAVLRAAEEARAS